MWHIGLENTLVRSEMLITYYCKVTAIKSKYWQIFIGQNVKIMTPVIVGYFQVLRFLTLNHCISINSWKHSSLWETSVTWPYLKSLLISLLGAVSTGKMLFQLFLL